MRWWNLTLVGLFAYLCFLAASLPARHLLGWLEGDNMPVAMQGVKGTIWSGQAEQAVYRKNGLGAVSWGFEPLGLFRGRLEYRFALRDQGQEVKGFVSSTPLGDQFQLREITGLIGMENLLQLLEQSHLQARGRLDLNLQEVGFSPQQLHSAEGSIRWLDAGINSPVPLELGGLQIDLANENENILTRIKDLNGPIKVEAEVNLSPDREYLITGKIKQQGPDSQGLSSLLRSFGKPAADGSIQINYKGRL
jgi:hypothetical protein